MPGSPRNLDSPELDKTFAKAAAIEMEVNAL